MFSKAKQCTVMQNKCLKTCTAWFWRTSVLVYSYFLAHAAGSGGCDNDITGDIGKNVSFCKAIKE